MTWRFDMQLTRPAAAALAALTLVPAGAVAATYNGGPENERFVGTRYADQIHAGPGDDGVNGRLGDDLLTGGPGNDRLHGARGNDDIRGDANLAGHRTSFDRLRGVLGSDTPRGGQSRGWTHGG